MGGKGGRLIERRDPSTVEWSPGFVDSVQGQGRPVWACWTDCDRMRSAADPEARQEDSAFAYPVKDTLAASKD